MKTTSRTFLLSLSFFLCLSSIAFGQVKSTILSEQTQSRFERVPEFDFIIQEANKLGVKVYLFGGTASAFAHYVRWDLEREKGSDKYQKERFDYDFTNIYRGNQDLDIVVDGTAEEAKRLQDILQEKYPHFIGEQDAWEVRLLREQIGDKLPLLDDYDFKNQHTDTNSTGMLALNPDSGEIVYRDLMDWENPDSRFLKDVSSAKIKFLYSDKHETTSRFKEDKNPAVLSAIRYIAKLSQYEVQGTKEDMDLVEKIVRETPPDIFNDYVKKKGFEFGLKALLNAPDVEFAWNLLDKTGLRKLLMDVDGNQTSAQDSLSWWFNKEPLRSFDLGGGDGETAKEIFGNLDIVLAHETNSFIAYDNITRSNKGRANAFVSRENTVGEAAVFGEGFYTRLGEEGARDTGLTIRFKLNPEAKEGTDFIREDDFILIKNKNAIVLIQEDLSISMADYFKLLSLGEITRKDKGLIEKFNRKFNRLDTKADEFKRDFKEAREIVRDSFFIGKDFPKDLSYNFSNFEAKNFTELTRYYFEDREEYYLELTEKLHGLDRKNSKFKLKPEWIKAIIANGNATSDSYIAHNEHAKRYWIKRPKLIQKLVEKGLADTDIVEEVLATPYVKDHPEWIQSFLNRGWVDNDILHGVLTEPHWKDHPEWVLTLIERRDEDLDYFIAQDVLSQPHWKEHPDLVEKLIENGEASPIVAQYVLSQPHWRGYFEWGDTLIGLENDDVDYAIIHYVLTEHQWKGHPEWVMKLIHRGNPDHLRRIAQYVLIEDHWKNHPELKKYLNGADVSLENLMERMDNEISFEDWRAQQVVMTPSSLEAPLCGAYLL